jgi:nicotinic acid phosphoribosyltransferase
MEKNAVSYTQNSKGYKVFNKYRIIWGDGVTPDAIDSILNLVTARGYSAENIAFGSGGDLMQNLNRDTHKFAIKASAAKVGGIWRDVYKDPITDAGKVSKKGLLTSPKLVPVYLNGKQLNTLTMSQVTANTCKGYMVETQEKAA